jgi:hypothetical protein
MTSKVSHHDAARNAAKTLASKDSSKAEKCAAASTLAQSKHPEKVTSAKVASEAARVLQNPNSSPEARSAAASALVQRETKDN